MKNDVIKNFKMFEESVNYKEFEYNDTSVEFDYYKYYKKRHNEFRKNLLDHLRKEFIGKTLYLYGKRHGSHKELNEIEKILRNKDKKLIPIYKVIVKNVEMSKEFLDDVEFVNVLGIDDEIYRLRKLVSRERYDNFIKDIINEIKNREKIKEITRSFDPYNEDDWGDFL